MKITKKMRQAVHAEVSAHAFPYRAGGGLGTCLRCGAVPTTQEFESALDEHVIDVAIDFVAGMLEAKYQPKRYRKLSN